MERIGKEIPEGDCIVCAINSGKFSVVLERNDWITVMLSAFPRCWGQVMINLNRHAENFSDLNEAEWNALHEAAFRYAKKIEVALKPVRVYTSMMGAPSNLPNTCPHLHLNVLPVYDAAMKPADLYTWEFGVYAGTVEEWGELERLLKL